jgi:hypothetical protein
MTDTNKHNLDIKMYSFKELLGLFNLSYNFGEQDLKHAKIKTLRMHPDKSGLSAEYFIFYSQAYRMLAEYYVENQRTSKTLPQTPIIYSANPENSETNHGSIDETAKKQVKTAIKKMKPEDFNTTFNRLFDQNMAKKPNPQKNAWFSSETPEYEIPKNATKQSIDQQIDKIKQRNQAIVKYREFRELSSSAAGLAGAGGAGGSKLYDQTAGDNDDFDNDDDEYQSSDPFSKLKYDDLRKVHKDQTVLAVSERDLSKIHQYESSEHLMRERSAQSIAPLEKAAAEAIIQMREKEYKERMLAKQHAATLESMTYAQKNKDVVASFLQIKY